MSVGWLWFFDSHNSNFWRFLEDLGFWLLSVLAAINRHVWNGLSGSKLSLLATRLGLSGSLRPALGLMTSVGDIF